MQITIIGGGSYQWAPKLITDICTAPALHGAHVVLEDIDPVPLATMEAFAHLAADRTGARITVSTTTDQRRALDGADFVVVTITTGGFASMAQDLDVPARFGIRQSIGDTVGPGGINRALRNVPVLVAVARDMEEQCADAWMLNLTNPMTALTWAVSRETSTRVVGLCHEVGNFAMDLAIAVRQPHTAVDPTVVGINHLPVIVALDVAGRDGLRIVRDMVGDLGGLEGIAARTDGSDPEPFSPLDFARRHLLKLTLLDRWGVLPGAGDRHVAEFVPSILTEASGWGEAWGITPLSIGGHEEFHRQCVDDVGAVLAGTKEIETWESGEMVVPVIDSLVTGTRRHLPLNRPNEGQCPDLPAGAVVEAMCVVDGDGIRGRDGARAPEAPTEILRRHLVVQDMTIRAALDGDRRLVGAAHGLDPLGGRGDFHATVAMADGLLSATARWLPAFPPVAD